MQLLLLNIPEPHMLEHYAALITVPGYTQGCVNVTSIKSRRVAYTNGVQIWNLQEGLTKPRANEHQALRNLASSASGS